MSPKVQDLSLYTIGHVAKAAGVGVDTARGYVQQGLLSPTSRTVRGHGLYSAADIECLRIIYQAKAYGLTLDEIVELLTLQEDSGRREQARARARRRIVVLDRKIRKLTAIRDAFAALERQRRENWPVTGCPIIESAQTVFLAKHQDP